MMGGVMGQMLGRALDAAFAWLEARPLTAVALWTLAIFAIGAGAGMWIG